MTVRWYSARGPRLFNRVLDENQNAPELLETFRREGGRCVRWDRHLGRLERSAAQLGFASPVERARALVEARVLEAPDRWERLRLLAAADGSVRLEADPLPESSMSTERVRLAPAALPADDPWRRHKSTRRRSLDRLREALPECFDVLLWNERGELTELTRGNLVLEIDARRWTPPLRCGLLPGTFREELLEARALEERLLPVEALREASAAWMINSVRGWVPIVVDEGREE